MTHEELMTRLAAAEKVCEAVAGVLGNKSQISKGGCERLSKNVVALWLKDWLAISKAVGAWQRSGGGA